MYLTLQCSHGGQVPSSNVVLCADNARQHLATTLDGHYLRPYSLLTCQCIVWQIVRPSEELFLKACQFQRTGVLHASTQARVV